MSTSQADQAPALGDGASAWLRPFQAVVERELLKLALQTPALVAPVLDAFGEDEFPTPAYRAVRAAVAAAGGVAYGADGAGDAWVGLVREACPDDAVRALVTELAVEPLRTRREADALYAGGFLVSLRAAAVDRRVSEVRGYLSRLGPETDPAHYTEVQRELWELQQYAQALRERGVEAL